MTCEREQKVERSFKSLDVDNERRLVGGTLRRHLGRERNDFGGHDIEPCVPASAAIVAINVENAARAAATSSSSGIASRASARAARAAGTPASVGLSAATACISA